MNAIQIVILTILGMVVVGAFVSGLNRSLELKDDLWVEPLVIVMAFFFAYLVVK